MSNEIPGILNSDYYIRHGEILCQSYKMVTGKSLLKTGGTTRDCIRAIYDAPFALVSHGVEKDPVFNFGNRVALELFEFSWDEFIHLPSRKSAEPINREERQRLLSAVTRQGYIHNYSGIRISSTGKRFFIREATVWNLINDKKIYCGQAAVFEQWKFV